MYPSPAVVTVVILGVVVLIATIYIVRHYIKTH